MTQESRDDELDALLSQGRLSGPRRDRILAGALAQAGVRRPRWRRAGVWMASLAAAATAVLLFARPASFRARGGSGAVLELASLDGDLASCRAGARLIFRAASAEPGFLSAWAEPLSGGSRVWYFPGSDGSSPRVDAGAEMHTLPAGVSLGPEQPPGRYRVHLLLSRRALTREECLAPPAGVTLGTAEVPLGVSP
jgi:hypothetical protein